MRVPMYMYVYKGRSMVVGKRQAGMTRVISLLGRKRTTDLTSRFNSRARASTLSHTPHSTRTCARSISSSSPSSSVQRSLHPLPPRNGLVVCAGMPQTSHRKGPSPASAVESTPTHRRNSRIFFAAAMIEASPARPTASNSARSPQLIGSVLTSMFGLRMSTFTLEPAVPP